MTNALTGKNAIVTGGTAGIGRKTVELLVVKGANVLFTGTNSARGHEVAKATGATFLPIDATSPDHATKVVKASEELWRTIDILVNNAGGAGQAQSVEKTTRDVFDEAMALNVWAAWDLIRTALPNMRANGGGAIVNVSSAAAQRVGTSSAAYAVSKAALNHLTHCAAAEFGEAGVRINTVSPGFVETDIHAKALRGDDDRKKKFVEGIAKLFLRRQPLKHLGQPDDIADIIAYLVSDQARFITGADIVADGGLMWSRNE